jgi:preprotein translocase subunit SecF
MVRGLNYSIEFTGGTLLQVNSKIAVDVAAVRHSLDQNGVGGAEIQSFGGAGDFVIRARLGQQQAAAENTEATAAAVKKALDASLGADNYTILRAEAVGPKVGSELRQKAFLAIMFAFGAILIYLAFRFEWRFGLASIGATAHDILGTIIFISLLRLEVSLVVVGAVLSVLGLSLNETIIIFDRVRENERHRRYPDLKTTFNRSINETLPRTVLTHGTALATMMTLAIFGGEVIRPFALVMFWGVFTGIFSSMFIAPAVLLYIRQRWPLSGTTAPRTVRAAPAANPPSRSRRAIADAD